MKWHTGDEKNAGSVWENFQSLCKTVQHGTDGPSSSLTKWTPI